MNPGKTRTRRKPTAQRIRNRALGYLSKRDATSAHLREVLLRRALKDADFHGMDRSSVEASVGEVITSLEETGLLDDSRVVPARARFEARRGQSDYRIRMKLAAHGVEGEDLSAALDVARNEESEEVRGFRYARRRRIGPYGREERDEKEKQRQMASLIRAGFPLDLARKIISCERDDVPESVPVPA